MTNPRPNPRQPACPQCGGLHVGSTGCPYAETVCDVCHKTLLQHPGYCFCEGGKTEHQPQQKFCTCEACVAERMSASKHALAGDPPSVTEPEKCPKCHSTARRIFHKPCDNGSMTNPTKKAHPWHNAAQLEPREEMMPNDPQSTRTNTTSAVTGTAHPNETLAVANTPQPDLEGGWKAEFDKCYPQAYLVGQLAAFRKGWLAARRLSPDRKLVEALRNLTFAVAGFDAYFDLSEAYDPNELMTAPTDPSGMNSAMRALYEEMQNAEAALKTQEPASPQTRKE